MEAVVEFLVGVMKVIPQERVSIQIVEQIVDLPFPEFIEEIVGAARLVTPVQLVVKEILEDIKDIRQNPGCLSALLNACHEGDCCSGAVDPSRIGGDRVRACMGGGW